MDLPYRIYRKEKIQTHKNYRAILFCLGWRKCLLLFTDNWSTFGESVTAHLEFYALSDGWQKYTETGYHSNFINLEKNTICNDAIVKKYFISILEAQGFDSKKPFQPSLF